MSRALTGLNRFAAVVLGLILLVGGVALVVWYTGHLPRVPHALHANTASTLVGYSWWDWAEGAAGVILILLGLRWLAAHVPSRTSSSVRLAQSDDGGALDVDLRTVANQAATAMSQTAGVSGARGKVGVDRGDATLEVIATIDVDADLAPIIAAAGRTVGQVAHVLGSDTPVTRVRLKVDRASRPAARVE